MQITHQICLLKYDRLLILIAWHLFNTNSICQWDFRLILFHYKKNKKSLYIYFLQNSKTKKKTNKQSNTAKLKLSETHSNAAPLTPILPICIKPFLSSLLRSQAKEQSLQVRCHACTHTRYSSVAGKNEPNLPFISTKLVRFLLMEN